MNYNEFAEKVKLKYPQYKDMDNRVLSQKMIAKYPQYKDVTLDEPKMDWKGVVGKSVKDIFQKPATYAKDLGTNPQTMANAIPGLMGAAGGISPIPMGATLGTGAGQGIRDLALMGLKKPIPSGLQHAGELGTALLGDIAAIPQIKKAYYGKQIGAAERAAGIGSVPKEAPPGSIRTAVKFLNGLKDKELTVQEAKRLKPAVDTIFQKGWLRGTQYEPDLVQVSQKIQSSLNQIPGRGAASSAMAKAMTIPRGINQLYQKLPSSVRRGLGYGTGVGLAGGASFELIKKLLGGG